MRCDARRVNLTRIQGLEGQLVLIGAWACVALLYKPSGVRILRRPSNPAVRLHRTRPKTPLRSPTGGSGRSARGLADVRGIQNRWKAISGLRGRQAPRRKAPR